MVETISLNDAARRGITRVRQTKWANPMDHVEITILDGGNLGLWAKLWCPFNTACNGKDPIQMDTKGIGMVSLKPHEQVWVPYTGPLPDSEEYRADVARFPANLDAAGG